MTQITVVGGGKMGEALIAGISRVASQGDLSIELNIVESDDARVRELEALYSMPQSTLDQAAADSEVLILAVKPQGLVELANQMRELLTGDQVIVSVAAGASIEFLTRAFGDEVQIVRVMPNTPALLGKGMTGISFAPNVSPEVQQLVREIFGSVGEVAEIDERLQDALTSVSGSGPAYFFAFVEAMAAGGQELGLDEETSKTLAKQTIIGAAAMLEQTGDSATTLRENVTSPNGTTQAALESFAISGLQAIVAQAERAAANRSVEMTSQLFEQLDQ